MTLNGKAIIQKKDQLGPTESSTTLTSSSSQTQLRLCWSWPRDPPLPQRPKLFVDADLGSHLSGSEALTILTPQNEAFKEGVTMDR
nr:transforming growth factor-beta-induced protein ig-h3-like [Salvelinus alpinus]